MTIMIIIRPPTFGDLVPISLGHPFSGSRRLLMATMECISLVLNLIDRADLDTKTKTLNANAGRGARGLEAGSAQEVDL
jgi:hypothetical protein